MALSNIIKELRILNKMTQKELADICCVSRNCISNWERSIRKPGVEDLVILSKVFNYPLEKLIEQLLFEKSVNSIVYNTPKRKLKISFVVPLMNIIIVVLVCIMLTASLIINRHFYQKAKYNNDSMYEQNIESITLNLKYLNNNYYCDFFYNEKSDRYEINDLNFYNYFNGITNYSNYSNEENNSNQVFVKIQVKYYDNNNDLVLNIEAIQEYSNLLCFSDKMYFFIPFQNDYLDFVIFIQGSSCYVGAFVNKKGE